MSLLALWLISLQLDLRAEDSFPPPKSKAIEAKKLFRIDAKDYSVSGPDAIRYRGVFLREGHRYRRFESSLGSLFVLDNSQLSAHDIERAECVPSMAPGMAEITESPLVGAETNVSKTDEWKAYSALIQQTIKSRCDGSVPTQASVTPHLDLGISHSIKDKNGDEAEIRVFNRDLQPNLNIGAHF